VGGEYGAGWSEVGQGTLLTTYLPSDGSPPFVVDKRDLTDNQNAVVVYHNPYDNIEELAHLFFKRCLAAKITPYIVTKKTVFKWQEPFWANMKKVFDANYKADFVKVSSLTTKPESFFCSIYSFFSMPTCLGWPHGRMWRGASALDF
jgi:isocitrate dehydrogenase